MRQYIVGVAFCILAVTMMSARADAGTIYAVDFTITNSSSYDSVDFDVDHSAANGTFVGSGDTVQCTTNSSLSAMGVYNEVSPVLRAALMRLTAFQTPVVLVTCNFDANGAKPTPSQFVITLDDWGPQTAPTPSIDVSRIQ